MCLSNAVGIANQDVSRLELNLLRIKLYTWQYAHRRSGRRLSLPLAAWADGKKRFMPAIDVDKICAKQ